MNESASEGPKRRPRYRGKNPRAFHEKYKEHRPDQYAADVAKVIAGGKTPAGTHRPIMVREIMDALSPKPGEIAVDCTLGYGGHARELLAAVQPGGRLIGIDADPIELPKTEVRLRSLGFPPESLVVKRANFAGLHRFLATEAPEGADMVLADLGLSSMQIDNPTRGFTFKEDGPLDMRMNPLKGLPASEFLSTLNHASLARILSENADEPFADAIALAILRSHQTTPLKTTKALADVVRSLCGRIPGGESAVEDTIRRVFQAIRIAVNDEFGAIDALMRAIPDCLKPGGRVAILTFHSGEDRRVKSALKDGYTSGIYSNIAQEVVRASFEERRSNPRSISAKLRYATRQ